jgi:hypothetical protein
MRRRFCGATGDCDDSFVRVMFDWFMLMYLLRDMYQD